MAKQKDIAVMIHGSKWRPIPFGNGGSFTMWRNYQSLKAAGYEVFLVKIGDHEPSVNYDKDEIDKLSYKTIKMYEDRKLYNGRFSMWLNSIIGIKSGFYPPGETNIKPKNTQPIMDEIKNPKIILAQNPFAAYIANDIWKKSKIILCMHDIDYDLNLRKKLKSLDSLSFSFSRLYYVCFAYWNFYFHFYSFYKLVKTVDSIIVHGKNMQKRLNFFSNKTEFFAPIVNSNNSFKLEIPNKLKILEHNKYYNIIYIGKLSNSHTQNSLPFLIDSILPKLNNLSSKKFKLRVIGSIENSSGMYHKFKKNDNVEFVGFLNILKEEYINAFCQIVPEGLNTGVRIKIIESLSYGCPVITSINEMDTLGLKKDSGCLASETVEDYIKNISNLIDLSFYTKTCKDALNTFNKYFSKQKVIPLLASFLKSF